MFRLLNYKSVSGILLLLVLWLGVAAYDAGTREGYVRKEVTDLSGRISSLERENQFLNRSEEYFKSEAFLERQARVKLNYKLPGEQVVFVYDAVASSQPETFTDMLKRMENYKKWWYFLLGY
jgi:cell division protein FtsB